MADDPNRDLLPVKEGSCLDTCRCSILDHRDRHAVCKLDRYQLEDRYLRMLDEVLELKKLSNTQEDKIKRLATKLMRVSATPRSSHATTFDFHNDKNRFDSLELENAKLKDKITVLRSQILNHKIGRSPSDNRRLQICTSGPTTCRSDLGRVRSSTSHFMRENERDNRKDNRNYIARIEELEMERKEMISRIEDMEIQIAGHEAGNQRQKVAENVEFIRLWRQVKLQNEQLAASHARNVSLEEQIHDLKQLIDEKTRNNKEITTALLAEKAKFSEMNEQLARAKNSQLNLREKDEQIRDMMNEMKILHQHNAELISLSSKYSQAELENIELKKKISEQLLDNQSLKSAFSNERANITALQAANEQLMGKLHELQSNIDSLTIQLKSFQSKNETNDRTGPELQILRTVDRQTSTNSLIEKFVASEENFLHSSEICKKCCQILPKAIQQSKPIFVTREVQTDDEKFENRRNSSAEAMRKRSPINFAPQSSIHDGSFQHDNGNLSREEMLKLLEQAQINTPLDAQNISRLRRVESSTKNHRNLSDSRQSLFPVAKKNHQSLAKDPLQILLILYKILRENNPNMSSKIFDDSNFYENENAAVGQSFDNSHDENNNTISLKNQRDEYHKKMENKYPIKKKNSYFTSNMRQRSHESLRENLPDEYLKNLRIENLETRPICRMDKYTEMTSDCCCRNSEMCNDEHDCGYACAQTISVGEITKLGGKFDPNFKSVVSDISTSIQKTFDNIHMSRLTRGDDSPFESYKSWQRPCQVRNSTNSMSNKRGKFIICSKAINDDTAIRKIGQCRVMRREKNSNFTNKKCIGETPIFEDFPCIFHSKENCGDGPIVCESGSYPMLITNDQGLLEIHIMHLQLTSMGSGIFSNEKNINDLSLFITWDIWNQKKAFTPSVKYPKFNFNSSSIYRLSRLFEFFDFALGQSISFRVHVSRQDETTSCPVARACLSIKDILDYPQNKLHYVANFSSILPCSHDQDFGQLSLWIRLSCDFEILELFKKRRRISSNSSASKKISKIKTRKNDEKNINGPSPDSQVKKQQISSDLHEIHVRSSNKLPSGTSLRSENAMVGEKNFQSYQMDNKNISSSRGTWTITRTSKDSGLRGFTSEASSSVLQRSPINSTSKNNETGSAADSYLSISPEASAVKQSDSSIIRAMEDEATTSEETRNGEKKRNTGSSVEALSEEEKESKEDEKIETASINEFNNLIHNVKENNGTILSPRASTSSVLDVGSVLKDDNWDEYRRRSMATRETSPRPSIVPGVMDSRRKSPYPFPDYPTSMNDAVIIRIESLSLFQRCPLLDDPNIHRLYVEFSFLGYRGVELETISVSKPMANTDAYFNYMRKFEIDEKEHSTQRSKMRAMMREDENPTIKFIIVSEPLLEEMDTKECLEVGYAYLNIREHILRGRFKDVPLTITNADKTESIGLLKITLLGAEAIRRCMSDL